MTSSPSPITFSAALALHQQGQFAQAKLAYQRILRAQPRHFDALHLLGVLAMQDQDYATAIDYISRAIKIDPRQVVAHYNLGLALQKAQQPDAALASLERALRLAPAHSDALYSHGNVLHALGRSEAALLSYERLLQHQPQHLGALSNRSMVLHQLQRHQAALVSIEQVLALHAEYDDALYTHGNVLQALGQFEAALASYERALQLKPTHFNTLFNRGLTLFSLNRMEQGLRSFEQAQQLQPEHLATLQNRCLGLQDLNQIEAALSAYEQVLQRTPDDSNAATQVIHLRQHLCRWEGLDQRSTALRARVAQGPSQDRGVTPFSFLTLATSAAEQQRCARHWADARSVPLSEKMAFSLTGRRTLTRPLRIAYLSADLHQHATANLVAGVIEAHQRQALDCIAYSYGPDDGSPMRRRLQAAFSQFNDISTLSERAAAEKIHADGIDILIDLKGYTQGEKSTILAYRPAPVQVQFLGYPGTMGSSSVDYLIADRFVIPPEHFAYYDEHIVHLPHCYQPNDPQRVIGQVPSRLEAGLPASGFVFCCFNQSYKITPTVFSQWMRLLQATPGSVLWLLMAQEETVTNLRREAGLRGVEGQRLIFAPYLPQAAHLGRLSLADLFLDTTPVNAHTTASDALWAGVPVLTCPGQTFASRVAGSLLQTMGLDELITTDAQHYEQLAYRLATSPQHLAALKEKLAAARTSSPLFDAHLFADHLATAYHKMWQRYQTGLPPAHLTLP